MWFEVEITATATISVEADDKSAAEAKISRGDNNPAAHCC